jgi:hypothetical protein
MNRPFAGAAEEPAETVKVRTRPVQRVRLDHRHSSLIVATDRLLLIDL